jgi:AcrR family transcriptional regulator
MPRIAAASLEEHVRLQTERITVAARRCFAANGFHATDMGDIAATVGLARNSLYRYFGSKDELLLACIKEDMQPHLQRLETFGAEFPDPLARIVAWLNLQFDIATGPEHATMELMNEVREAKRSLRKDIEELHAAPARLLEGALRERNDDKQANLTLAAIISGVVMAATSHALRVGAPEREGVRAAMIDAVTGILTQDSDQRAEQ